MQTPTLFVDSDEQTHQEAEPPQGPFASVALEQSIDRTLDYAIPPGRSTDKRGQEVNHHKPRQKYRDIFVKSSEHNNFWGLNRDSQFESRKAGGFHNLAQARHQSMAGVFF